MKNKISNKRSKRYFFLIGGVFIEPTAIEIQACVRAKLFKEYFNVMPTIITHGFEPNLKTNLKVHCESRDYKEEIPIFSIFDFYCDKMDKAEHINNQSYEWQQNFRYEVDRNNLNNYYVFNGEKLQMYIQYHPYTRLIDYVNYISHVGNEIKIIKRDYYDEQGYLSQTGVVDPKTKAEKVKYLLDRNGKQRLEIHYNIIGNNQPKVTKIFVYNKNGMVTNIFDSHEDLVADSLQKIADLYPDDELYFFIEHSIFYQALRKLKHPNKNIISIFHDIHTISPEVEDAPYHKHFTDALAEARTNSELSTIILTDKQKEDIEKRLIKFDNLHVIPNTINYDFPQVEFEKRDRFLLTSFVRLSPVKQVDKTIEMFSIVKKAFPQAKLEIYGVGELHEMLQRKINNLSLTESVKLKGFIKNPYKVFEKAGLTLLTSRSEAYPLVITESLATGCPFISFDVNYGPSDMIKNGENGYLISPNNIEEMARKIIFLLNNPVLHKKMSENAYKSKNKFSMETVVKKWKEFFEKLENKNN